MKFGRIVPQVDTQRLMGSDFGYDVILLRWWPAMTSFREKPLSRSVWRHWLAVCATVPDPDHNTFVLVGSDQLLIWYRYLSCSSFCCWGDVFKHLKSDRGEIWQNLLQVNTLRLTESDFRFDVTLSRWRPWRHSTQQSAATWWMKTKRLPTLMQQRPSVPDL